MKNVLRYSTALALLFLFNISSVYAQKEVKGIILNKEATNYFLSANYDFLKIEGDGTTKPINGYKMFLNKKDKSILISKHHTNPPKNTKIILKGADFFCSGCEEETCEIEKAKKGVGYIKNSVRYDCLGCFTEEGGVERCYGSLLIRRAIYRDYTK